MNTLQVRFGFVAMSAILNDLSPSRTSTAQNFLRQTNRPLALERLNYIASKNLDATARILRHAAKAGIPLYRFSSRLIPLFGHPATEGHDFFLYLARDFAEIGRIVREQRMRVSFHPDHFVVLSAQKEDIQNASREVLLAHLRMLEAMGLEHSARLVVHVGGAYGAKSAALGRFQEAISKLPHEVGRQLALENDDRTFDAGDVLRLAGGTEPRLPVVIDTLHHACNPGGLSLPDALAQAFSTWDASGEPPKVHLSSARDAKNPRAHADFVLPEDGMELLEAARAIGRDFDVMIEAKQKDRALLRLLDDLSLREGVERTAGGVLRYRP